MQHKRPSERVRIEAQRRLQLHLTVHPLIKKISPTATGYVANIARILNSPDMPFRPNTDWTPPCEYKYIASKLPETEAATLIARCESWHEANPPPPRVTTQKEKSTLDMTPVLELQAKYNKRPPIEESIAAWRAAGLSEERLKKHRVWWNKMEATSEERQKALELIFVKYPSANKPIPKVKKVIKAVNKKKV
jgi:hypothetical protein